MQCAVVEFARNVCQMKGPILQSSFRMDLHYPVISLLPGRAQETKKGGTMRLGLYPVKLRKGTKAYEAYQEETVKERHRHRCEVNSELLCGLEQGGLMVSGVCDDRGVGGDYRVAGSPLVCCDPLPSGVQVTPAPPAPAFPGVCRGCASPPRDKFLSVMGQQAL